MASQGDKTLQGEPSLVVILQEYQEAVAAGHPRVTDPYAPSYHHLYRGGAVPTRGAAARMAG